MLTKEVCKIIQFIQKGKKTFHLNTSVILMIYETHQQRKLHFKLYELGNSFCISRQRNSYLLVIPSSLKQKDMNVHDKAEDIIHKHEFQTSVLRITMFKQNTLIHKLHSWT